MSLIIEISNILVVDDFQPRCKLNNEVVEDYAKEIAAKKKFPPIVVYQINSEYHLVDGRHRLDAYRKNGHEKIECDVKVGSRQDALLFAVGANADHGLRRTNADKRRVVKMLLNEPSWKDKSNNAIAEQCKVTEALVRKVKKEMDLKTDNVVDKNGRKMGVKNIGGNSKKSKPGDMDPNPNEPAGEPLQVPKEDQPDDDNRKMTGGNDSDFQNIHGQVGYTPSDKLRTDRSDDSLDDNVNSVIPFGDDQREMLENTLSVFGPLLRSIEALPFEFKLSNTLRIEMEKCRQAVEDFDMRINEHKGMAE